MRLLFSLVLPFCLLSSPAADFFVSPSGSDSAVGSIGSPWKTVGFALDQAGAGDTVFLRGGVYLGERVSFPAGGAAGAPLVLRNFPGETPVLDGGALTVLADGSLDALVTLRDVSHVTVRGLTIQNLTTALRDRFPVGVLVEATSSGGSAGITLANLTVRNIEQTYDDGLPHDGSGLGSDAHGIAVYGRGSNQSRAVTDVLIQDCEVSDLKLGTSEALVINGNVDGFTVRGCRVRDCNNIGIDAIGFEGNAPEAFDQARNGIIEDCEVSGIDTTGNPGYRNPDGSFDLNAAGIYIDGGKDIIIQRCRSHGNNAGMELASENNGKATSGITLRNNFIYDNTAFTGLLLGGFASSGVGFVSDCIVANNTFIGNDSPTGFNGQVHLQFDVRNCKFQNNIIVANPATGIFVGDPSGGSTRPLGNTFSHNLYFNPGDEDSTWTYNGVDSLSFSEWKDVTGGGSGSTLGDDPLLAGDLRISGASPAIETGSVTGIDPGSVDIEGQPRIAGGIDRGADEFSLAMTSVEVLGFSDTRSVSYQGAPAQVHQLEMSTDLTTWMPVEGELSSSGEGLLLLPVRDTRGFFRVSASTR